MNISNILITTLHPFYESLICELSATDGITLHYCDRDSSQIIVTQTSENLLEEIEGFERIKHMPYVLMAERVGHYHLDSAA